MGMTKIKIRMVRPDRRHKKYLLLIAGIGLCGVLIAIGVPQLRLVGVHNDSLAIIENIEEGTQDVFEVGGDVYQGGQLVKVESDHVVVLKDGEEHQLALKAGVSVAQTLEEMALEVPNLFRSSDEFQVVPFEMLSAKTAPIVRDQQIVGFVLNEVIPNSKLASWGLAKSDIVQAVDGVAVRGMFDALDVIRRSDGKGIAIEVERNGEKKRLEVG